MKLNGSPMLLPYESWRIEQRNDFSEEFLPFDFAWGTLSFAVNKTIYTTSVNSTLSFGTVFIGEQRRACLFGGSTPQCLLAVSFAEANF